MVAHVSRNPDLVDQVWHPRATPSSPTLEDCVYQWTATTGYTPHLHPSSRPQPKPAKGGTRARPTADLREQGPAHCWNCARRVGRNNYKAVVLGAGVFDGVAPETHHNQQAQSKLLRSPPRAPRGAELMAPQRRPRVPLSIHAPSAAGVATRQHGHAKGRASASVGC